MRSYRPGSPLVFNHIPKTGGTTVGRMLKAALEPTNPVGGFDTSLFGLYDFVDGASARVRGRIYLAPEDLPGDTDLVAGHIAPWTTMQRFPGSDHLTILRIGQIRLLSQWLHSRGVSEFNIRHYGPAGEAFRVGWGPLRDYLEHPGVIPNTDNTIARFLAFPHPLLQRDAPIDEVHDDELVGVALERLAAMQHVDVVENPRFLEDLGAWLGRPLSSDRLNERASVPTRRRPDLVAELAGGTRDLLDHRHRLDARLWQHVAARAWPGEDVAARLRSTVDAAIERYVEILQRPHEQPLARRILDAAYDVRVRLDPRRRSAFR